MLLLFTRGLMVLIYNNCKISTQTNAETKNMTQQESVIPPNLPQSIDISQLSSSSSDNEKVDIIYNYINGEFKPSSNATKYIVNRSPVTSKILNYLTASTTEDVDEAVKAAKKAFDQWKLVGVIERSNILHRIANELEKQKEQLARLESADTGKTYASAFNIDISRAISNFRFFANEILQAPTACHPMDGPIHALNYTLRQPVGVAALISPWNLPLYLLSWKVAPALACGNTIVAKCSELSPMTANALAQIIHQITEIPHGVFNLVHGYGSECGSALVSHPLVDLVSFTGGTHTGKIVGSIASSMLKKVSLECGGKNALLVFDDADLDKAVELAKRASFANTGQVCLCPSRILVHESIHDQFVERFVKAVNQIKVGDPNDPNIHMGSLISVPHRSKVQYYIELAKTEGGTVACGGQEPSDLADELKNGAFLLPTIITGLDVNSRTATEEIFGCVVTVHKFNTEQEAVEMANATNYGLCAAICTKNVNTAHRVSAKLDTGMVWVNGWLVRDLRVPFGGVKMSGVGREGGSYSLEFYSHDKNVCIVFDE
jgi:acyl-CoA reductase-like NAD-dependent aldehyde dehydrogenase